METPKNNIANESVVEIQDLIEEQKKGDELEGGGNFKWWLSFNIGHQKLCWSKCVWNH